MAGTLPWADVQATGGNRLSLGAALCLRVMDNLAESATELRACDLMTASGEAPSSSAGLSFGELHQAMSKARRSSAACSSICSTNALPIHTAKRLCGNGHDLLGPFGRRRFV